MLKEMQRVRGSLYKHMVAPTGTHRGPTGVLKGTLGGLTGAPKRPLRDPPRALRGLTGVPMGSYKGCSGGAPLEPYRGPRGAS